jgi:nitroimidazol reductase NimA-like FMN-containing flavoprotein (pyridoxamine 5'-phosphate oxidase superfamily)
VVIQGTRVLHLRYRGPLMTDFSEMARAIIESNRYMVLGTADDAGVPWVTPLWYAQSGYRDFLWVSSPDRRHSRNVTARPEVSIAMSICRPGPRR